MKVENLHFLHNRQVGHFATSLTSHDGRLGQVHAMKTEILHLLNDRQVGGTEKALSSLCNSQLRKNFQFTIADYAEGEALLKKQRFDACVVHDPCRWPSLPQFLRLKMYNRKILIHEHHYSRGFEQWSVPAKRRFHLMLRLFYRLADYVVAVSHGQARWMRERKLLAPERLVVIQQSQVLDGLLQLPLRPIHSPLVLAAYGRFVPAKGFDDLINAVRQLSPNAFHLRIGGYGPEEERLKRLAQEQKNIEFCGLIRNLPEFLGHCDGVIIPSRMEPWGNVGVEAKAAAKPVLAAAVDGLPEQVQSCGMLVSSSDPPALAHALSQFITTTPQQLQTWGHNGREEVRTAWETYLSHWQALLWKMTAREALSPASTTNN